MKLPFGRNKNGLKYDRILLDSLAQEDVKVVESQESTAPNDGKKPKITTGQFIANIFDRKPKVDPAEKEVMEFDNGNETHFFAPSPYFSSTKSRPKTWDDLPKGRPSRIKGVIISESHGGKEKSDGPKYSQSYLVRNNSRIIVINDDYNDGKTGEDAKKKNVALRRKQSQFIFMGQDLNSKAYKKAVLGHVSDDGSTASFSTAGSSEASQLTGSCTATTGDSSIRKLNTKPKSKSLLQEVAEEIGNITIAFVMDASNCIGMGCATGVNEAVVETEQTKRKRKKKKQVHRR